MTGHVNKHKSRLNLGISKFVEAPSLNTLSRKRHPVGLQPIGQVQGPR